MPSSTETQKNVLFLFGLSAALLTLAASIVLFPTILNPGVTIFIGGALAILAGVLRLTFGSGRYYRTESDIATLLLAWMAICTVFTVDQYLSRKSLGSFVGAVAFIWICQITLANRAQWRTMAISLIALCTTASVFAWIPALDTARATGTLPPLMGFFNNQDTFSILPLLALCLTLGIIEKSGPAATPIHLLNSAFLLATIFGTACRGSVLGFVIAGSFFMVNTFRAKGERAEKTKLFVGFPLILALLALPVLGYNLHLTHKLARITESSTLEYEELRYEVFSTGWKAIAESPLFGSGPGAFGLNYQSVRPPNHDYHYIDIAHNDFLEMGTECGIPGLILWMALIFFAARTAFRYTRSSRRPTEAAGVLAAVLALTVYSLFNFIVAQRPVLWAELWVFGLALSFPSSRLKSEEPLLARIGFSLLLLTLGVWTTITGYNSARADQLYAQADQLGAKLQLSEAAELYVAASKLEPPRVDRTIKNVNLLEKIRAFEDEDNLPQQLDLLHTALASSPKSIPLLLKQAETFRLSGQPQEAAKSIEAAIQIAPHNRQVFQERLAYLVSSNQLLEAGHALESQSYERLWENRDKFINILVALESSDPGLGQKLAESWLNHHPDDKGIAVVDLAVTRARKLQLWREERALLQALHSLKSDDLCLKLQIAHTIKNEKGPTSSFDYLSQSLSGKVEMTDSCYDKALQEWFKLGKGLNRDPKLYPKLEEFIKLVPQRAWVRVELAKKDVNEKQYSEAAKLLREGLESAPNNTELLIALGETLEAQGSTALAINYYREALRNSPKAPGLQSKIDRLVKKK